MHILVTGGTGTVGRLTVERLVRSGHKVRVIGLDEGLEIAGADYRTCDINDFDALCQQVKDIEVIVHLAAIPHPSGGTAEQIFQVNCSGTFNVYQAAAVEGIKRVVSASSINALGFNFGVVPFQLSYFPIDEQHPTQTTDVYSLSKGILEDTAEYFWRRDGISGVCLRLPGVFDPENNARRRFANRGQQMAELMALPQDQQAEQVRAIWAQCEQMRQQRVAEKPRPNWRNQSPTPEQEQAFAQRRMVMGATNFWTGIHAGDSAQAFEKGLLADYEGAHPLFITQTENRAGVDSEALLRLFFPEVTKRTRPLSGRQSLVSIERAEKLIGFKPEHDLG
ncbi:MAG: NAD-dependent epimerase/dehydratase family protein [Candidatus Latescibacteria bacterium]|nr:NAD-dependent epimerase/dehydratase family protein [Candidatus Latescibacterota bacterium]